MNPEKDSKTLEQVARGVDLLTPFGIEPAQIAAFELGVSRFKNTATAKAWVKNHGFTASRATNKALTVDVSIRPEAAFEPGTLRRERLSGDVTAWVGTPLEVPAAVSDGADGQQDVQKNEVSEERAVKVRGDLFEVAKAAADPEDSVRVVGIVSKPEDPDSEGTVISAEEIERANFGFMKDFGVMGFMHQKDVSSSVVLIQNVIAPTDILFPKSDGTTKTVTKGTWYQELYTEDPDLVSRIRKGQLTGLSIGGFAKVEDLPAEVAAVHRSADGEVEVLPVHRSATRVEKSGPATNRFHNLRVEEVSLVDAAANEEEWLVIKRRSDQMSKTETKTKAEDVTKAAAPAAVTETAPAPEATPAPETPTPAEPTVAEQVAKGIEDGIRRALSQTAPVQTAEVTPAPAPAPEPDAKQDAVMKALDGITARLDAQDAKLAEVGVVRAAAKGASVPDTTTVPVEKNDGTPASKWAGTVVHQVAQRGRR